MIKRTAIRAGRVITAASTNAIPVIGLDPSMTCTAGHWTPAGDAADTKPFAIMTKPNEHPHKLLRLRAIRAEFAQHLDTITTTHGPGLLVVEGYAMANAFKAADLGELGGLLRMHAFDRGWQVIEVPPTSLKKFVTGKGNAEKDGMRMATFQRWSYESADNNDADAYGLMRLGLDFIAWRAGSTTTTKALGEQLKKLTVLDPAATMPEAPAKRTRPKKAAS